jgi:hypothetical protein
VTQTYGEPMHPDRPPFVRGVNQFVLQRVEGQERFGHDVRSMIDIARERDGGGEIDTATTYGIVAHVLECGYEPVPFPRAARVGGYSLGRRCLGDRLAGGSRAVDGTGRCP